MYTHTHAHTPQLLCPIQKMLHQPLSSPGDPKVRDRDLEPGSAEATGVGAWVTAALGARGFSLVPTKLWVPKEPKAAPLRGSSTRHPRPAHTTTDIPMTSDTRRTWRQGRPFPPPLPRASFSAPGPAPEKRNLELRPKDEAGHEIPHTSAKRREKERKDGGMAAGPSRDRCTGGFGMARDQAHPLRPPQRAQPCHDV